jgi:hypothetical protein
MWLVRVQSADCGNAPFSASTAFNPVWTGLDTASVHYIGNLTKIPGLNYGSTNNPTFTASGNGAQQTVEGVESGDTSFTAQFDSSAPLGDPAGKDLTSGDLYDCVVTFGFTDAADLTAGSAADAIVGRMRLGKFGTPIELSGANIEQSVEGMSDGRWYGSIIGQPNTASS